MPRTKLSADARRAATVETVIGLAAATNPADITTAQIAAQMDVTQGALFRHFADKQAIWAAVMDWTATTLLARFDAVTGVTPIERLRAMFATHIDFVVTHPGVPRILFGELQRDGDALGKMSVRALMAAYRERVTNLLTEAKAQSLIAETVDIPAAATMFLGMVQGLAMQAMAASDFTTMPAVSGRLFDLFCDGLGVAK
ncbi:MULTISPECIES: TetR/AcrR family transcriptional regulator [Sphingobium]|jgi:AcrR family transcriptional regulator|uniref:Transcriptional regulator, TetR family n=2 Tax=Sphingobium TaxID=165695 RepID=N1MWJ2_9SPHN|nr:MULTISPECIES: TetR family transcriptional regulator [Sphingobium]RYM11523.1 TetR family transcriptional regulator [Sphingobium cupriresistens]CCW19942.1 Transcriptional regulator, TetR family [Sphingobium indicum BiD32]